jgi:hypothetical protein
VTTTHIKQGWSRRNGLPSSDVSTLVEHYVRHGSRLTHVSVMPDPVFLAEPLIKSEDYNLSDNTGGNWLWPCEYVDELPGLARDRVPSFLPGENPFVHEFADRRKIPVEAALGGPETMYPEYKDKIKSTR